jgi:hypothetical protein
MKYYGRPPTVAIGIMTMMINFMDTLFGGFLSHEGTPIAGWFISWKIPL